MVRTFSLAICVVMSAVFFSACVLLPEEEILPPPIIPRVEIALRTETVERGDITSYERASGRAVPVRQYNVYFDFDVPNAVLLEHNIDRDNLRVRAGDVLAVFAVDDLETQVLPLRRALELARINYDAAVRSLEAARRYYADLQSQHERLRETTIETQQRDLNRLRTRLDDARGRYESDRALYELGIMSQDTFNASERALRDLIAEIDSFEASIARSEQQSDIQLEQSLRTARANAQNDDAVRRERIHLEAAENNLRELQERFERFVVLAPADGLITYFRELHVGDTYTANQRLLTISDDSALFVTTGLPEYRRRDFVPGARVELYSSIRVGEGRQSFDFEGIVISMSTDQRRDALLDDDTIVIDVTDWPEEVGAGTLVQINLIQESRYDVVVIPLSSLNTIGNFHFVRIAEGGVSRERQVEVGLRSTTMVEILHGLEPGEEIVVR